MTSEQPASRENVATPKVVADDAGAPPEAKPEAPASLPSSLVPAQSDEPKSLLVETLGSALLENIFDEMRLSYVRGGLDALDLTVDDISRWMGDVGCQYVLGPGTACEADESGKATGICVSVRGRDNPEILCVYWISLESRFLPSGISGPMP